MSDYKVRNKIVTAKTRALDDQGLVEAIVSTEGKDRDGDIIRASGWVLENFRAHPILLSSHNYRELRSQIGEWKTMEIQKRELVGTAQYYINDGNPEADWGFKLAQRGKAAYSVGFIPDMAKAKVLDDDDDGWWINYEFNGQELLEVSHVTVPSNPEGLQRLRSRGLGPSYDEILASLAPSEQYSDGANNGYTNLGQIWSLDVHGDLRTDEFSPRQLDQIKELMQSILGEASINTPEAIAQRSTLKELVKSWHSN